MTNLEDQPIYVQYGCGFSAADGWKNFDSSPTLRLERFPIVGRSLSAFFSGNSRRFPAAACYGDICKGLPVADGLVRGCYASHVLEHLSLDDLRLALTNTFRMLAPGGTFRLIVPDLHERARRYVAEADRKSSDAAPTFLRAALLGHERRPKKHFRNIYGRLLAAPCICGCGTYTQCLQNCNAQVL